MLVFEPKASNSVYMPTAGIHAKFVVGPCNQEYTDRYDITVSYDFINSTNPVMFGHNTRSLGPMYKVKVGDYIYLTENGKTTTYKVTHSEVGVDINYSTNIQGVNTGVLCIGNSSTKTLRIFTCYNSAKYGKCRWIILAQPV
jgi:sortase (surface protein transpeptidase)